MQRPVVDDDDAFIVEDLEQGEVQYLFDFVNPCGILIRFDHVLTLTPEFPAYADQLPAAQPDDSRTSPLPRDFFAAGTPVATAVGFATTANTSFDFGVYDLRAPNIAWQDPEYQSAHQGEREQAAYAVCWFDWLVDDAAARVRSLPAGDPQSGTTSDYCT